MLGVKVIVYQRGCTVLCVHMSQCYYINLPPAQVGRIPNVHSVLKAVLSEALFFKFCMLKISNIDTQQCTAGQYMDSALHKLFFERGGA